MDAVRPLGLAQPHLPGPEPLNLAPVARLAPALPAAGIVARTKTALSVGHRFNPESAMSSENKKNAVEARCVRLNAKVATPGEVAPAVERQPLSRGEGPAAIGSKRP